MEREGIFAIHFCYLLGFTVYGGQLFPISMKHKRNVYKALSHMRNLCSIAFSLGSVLRKL